MDALQSIEEALAAKDAQIAEKSARVTELTTALQQKDRALALDDEIIREQREALQAMQSRIITAAKRAGLPSKSTLRHCGKALAISATAAAATHTVQSAHPLQQAIADERHVLAGRRQQPA
jgi:hypothetical protein